MSWWDVHPQNDHATFDLCITITQRSVCLDILLLWHFDPVKFYYCDIFPVTFYILQHFDPFMICPDNLHPPASQEDVMSLCYDTTLFFLPSLWQDIHFCYWAKWGSFDTCRCSTSAGVWLGWRGGDKTNVTIKFSVFVMFSHKKFNLPTPLDSHSQIEPKFWPQIPCKILKNILFLPIFYLALTVFELNVVLIL